MCKSVRYVKVEAYTNYLQISQIAVYGTSGNNIALQGIASASSSYVNRPTGCVVSPAGAIDGKLIAKNFTKCSTATFGIYNSRNSTGAYWQVDLGASYDVSSIVYYNRLDGGYNSRAIGYTIKGLDSSFNIQCEAVITTGDLIQMFTSSTAKIMRYTPLAGNIL
jgi:hypothetical protein